MENRKTIVKNEKQDNRAKESSNKYKWVNQLCEKWGTCMLHITLLSRKKTAKTIGMRIKKRIFDEPDTETDETCRLLRANKEH